MTCLGFWTSNLEFCQSTKIKMSESSNNENRIVKVPTIPKLKWVILFCLLFSVAILLLSTGAYGYYQIYFPFDKSAESSQEFVVEKGDGLIEIANHLKAENLIRSPFWFQFYVWRQKQDTSLQAGRYALGQSFNIPQIVGMLTIGKIIPSEIQVTFPEGFSLAQIKARLIENGIQSAEFLDGEEIGDFQVQYKFLKGVVPQAGLEGFLFPDTYRFEREVKKEEVIKKFLDNFDKKLLPSWREEIDRQNKSLYDIVILASIVQQEAVNEQEMSLIAGIFWRRLEIGMPLESDVTVNYVTGKKLRQPTLADIKAQSPYNTYLHQGLPPGPICNPGAAAIEAAIYPQSSDYLYFLHPLGKPAVYSQTLEEHNKNKARYLK